VTNVDLGSLPLQVLETRRVLDTQLVRFRWHPAYSIAALEAVVSALPVGGELGVAEGRDREADRCLRRTPAGMETRIIGHGHFGEWKVVPPAQAMAWIADVADSQAALREGVSLSYPVP
jgi:hypothetical protein